MTSTSEYQETCSKNISKDTSPPQNLYPNCDTSIWLRTCTDEIRDPLEGITTGILPKWLKGSLLRNGPGALNIGSSSFEHLFDCSALLHRFAISDGHVTYQCCFLDSSTYKKNKSANRIVITEFGTKAVPDPCQTIFSSVAALFMPGEYLSDNAMISIYPFGDEFYAFTESPVIHKIDPITLETLDRVDVSKYVNIVNHTSHPHIMNNGMIYNLGLSITCKGTAYSIVEFPPSVKNLKLQSIQKARMVCSSPSRWKLHPSYMHTFGVTKTYYVIVEQPLSVSVPKVVNNTFRNEPTIASLQWYENEQTEIKLIPKDLRTPEMSFLCDPFFFLHVINQYEIDDHLIIDICCYKDPSMINCMYVDALKDMQRNPNYANNFRSRPLRFVLPLNLPKDLPCSTENLVTLKNSSAKAHKSSNGKIFVTPEILCNIGCETPRINYEKFMGTFYRYFYAISSDVDLENPGMIIKVDTAAQSYITWGEKNAYPSEPIFVARPDSKEEDDGILLSVLIFGHQLKNKVSLLILDAITMTEIARTEFCTPSPVPKCLHGWFSKNIE